MQSMPLLDPIPSPVENADIASLEWEPLLAFIPGYPPPTVGRKAILALRPSSDEPWITRQHQLTGELRLLLSEQVSIPLGGLFDPTQLAAKAQISGAALEAAEFQSVARLANDVAAWQALLREPPARVAGKLPGLSELSAALAGSSLKPLAASLERNSHTSKSPFALPCANSPAKAPRRKTSSPFAATASSSPSAANSSAASPALSTVQAHRAKPSTSSRSRPSNRTTNSSASSKKSRPKSIASSSPSPARSAATPRPSSKAPASSPSSTPCWPAPALPATTIALPPPSHPTSSASPPPATRCSSVTSARSMATLSRSPSN